MKQSPWFVRLTKLNSSYIQSDNPLGWKNMFQTFYGSNIEEISKSIFIDVGEDEGGVNDGWLKDSVTIEEVGPRKKGGWNRKIPCKGLIIYFSDKSAARDFSIPITEIYKDAINLSNSKGDSDVICASYPARILHGIYSILKATISKEDPTWSQLEKNTNVLKVYVEEILPNGDGSSDVGSGIQGFSKIMSQVMKSAGMSTDEMDSSGMEDALSKTLSGDTVAKMGKVFSKIVQSVSTKGSNNSEDPGDVMDRLGEVLKDKEVRELLTSSTKETSEAIGNLASSIPTASSVGQVSPLPNVEDDCDAGDQE
jgi:hypothetical protein